MEEEVAINKIVGRRIRERRRTQNISQKELAEKIGIAYQQLQKYETGANQVSSGRLFTIAKTLQVPVESFFPPSCLMEEIEKKIYFGMERKSYFECLTDELTMETAQMLHKIKDMGARAAIIQVIEKMGQEEFKYDYSSKE